LAALSKAPAAESVLDLGCGNGVLGIAYGRKQSGVKSLTLVDESFQAVQCAKMNATGALSGVKIDAVWQPGLFEAEHRYDLILLNPPFHQQFVVGDHLAHMLFEQAAKGLTPEGELWVVGNRHLNYHVSLKRYFRSVVLQRSSQKFVVFSCRG